MRRDFGRQVPSVGGRCETHGAPDATLCIRDVDSPGAPVARTNVIRTFGRLQRNMVLRRYNFHREGLREITLLAELSWERQHVR